MKESRAALETRYRFQLIRREKRVNESANAAEKLNAI